MPAMYATNRRPARDISHYRNGSARTTEGATSNGKNTAISSPSRESETQSTQRTQ